jgi:hypothetical protein
MTTLDCFMKFALTSGLMGTDIYLWLEDDDTTTYMCFGNTLKFDKKTGRYING